MVGFEVAGVDIEKDFAVKWIDRWKVGYVSWMKLSILVHCHSCPSKRPCRGLVVLMAVWDNAGFDDGSAPFRSFVNHLCAFLLFQ